MAYTVGDRIGIINGRPKLRGYQEPTVSEGMITYDDPAGLTKVRKVVRDGIFCLDIAITQNGFLGYENYDWYNLRMVL